MKEFRADGTLEGEPKLGRIYKMAHDGRIFLTLWKGEREDDLAPYIEKYDNFRGFVTGFLPLEEAEKRHEELLKIPTPPEELEIEKVKHLKKLFLEAHKKAEQAAHAYFVACPVGEERIRASEIYENIRTAIRI